MSSISTDDIEKINNEMEGRQVVVAVSEHDLSSSWMRIHSDVVLQLALLNLALVMRFRFHYAELARIVVARVLLSRYDSTW